MKPLTPKIVISLIGVISGAAMQMNWMANGSLLTDHALLETIFRLAAGAIVAAIIFWRIHLWIMKRAGNEPGETRFRQLALWNACSFAPALIVLLGINGTVMTREFAVVIIGAVVGLNLLGHMFFNSNLSLSIFSNSTLI